MDFSHISARCRDAIFLFDGILVYVLDNYLDSYLGHNYPNNNSVSVVDFLVSFLAWRMLVKVKYREKQKYVKVTNSDGTCDYQQFHQAVVEKFGLPPDAEVIYKDSSGTEVDPDIFSELLEKGEDLFKVYVNDDLEDMSVSSEASYPSDASTVILDDSPCETPNKKIRRDDQSHREAVKNMVNEVLQRKPGGEKIFQEYTKTKSLSDGTRRQLVNILVADMVEVHGRIPSQAVRVKYAQGIVALFPYLEDPLSKHGYEHFYDAASGSGYIAWRLKTVQRSLSDGSRSRVAVEQCNGGPKAARDSVSTIQQLTDRDCEEAISMMNHSSDEALVMEKMKATFEHRQKLVRDPDKSVDVLDTFPRFLDIPGLIEQDFLMLFGEEASGKFLARWPTFFRPHITEDAKGLVPTLHVEELLSSAQGNDGGWDRDIASLCLLLHLIPPTSKGHKKSAKISALQAEDYLVRYLQVGASIQIFLTNLEPSQPFLLCIGEQKNKIQKFYIIVDSKAIPCRAQTSVAAFDELFKTHFVFGTSYSEALDGFYTFIQTAVYNIDVGMVREKPRVRELRARFLNLKK
ncbi:uncharacterized protein LOC121718890 isoform X2 [Alosa sapidissima]|uniref:uncharacterized protein LOC121685888 isoform X2 n=1 Tax=Alosa sapidissima TaxID=34773 RepID=UPI001C090787|nr:uncharacterized protein LOC121685888 isoform X2 [Alosa sapidissima]XP_041960238.1 uncharacterized protein LOC121718890 isoform X2 [Alosa sapidissima]